MPSQNDHILPKQGNNKNGLYLDGLSHHKYSENRLEASFNNQGGGSHDWQGGKEIYKIMCMLLSFTCRRTTTKHRENAKLWVKVMK